MEAYVEFVKRQKRAMGLLLLSAIAYNMANHFFLPFIWNAMAKDITIEWYYYLLGIGGGMLSIIGFVMSYFLFCLEFRWNPNSGQNKKYSVRIAPQHLKEVVKTLAKIAGLYIGAQILLSVVMGGLAALIYNVAGIGFITTKLIVDVITGILQVLIQIAVLCMVIHSFTSSELRVDKMLFLRSLAVGYICYLCSMGYSFLDNTAVGLFAKGLFSSVLFLLLWVYMSMQFDKEVRENEA